MIYAFPYNHKYFHQNEMQHIFFVKGSPLRIPCVERKYLDLYTLQKVSNFFS